jgi:hypothetical protein
MKKLILVFISSSIFSQHYHPTFFDYDTLDINNIRLMSSNVGNSDGYGGFWEVLSSDYWNQSIIYDHGPWIIGKIGSDTVFSLSQWFSSYSPGPIINGQAAMLIHPEDSLKYRSYKVTRGDDNSNPDYAEWPVEFGAPVDNDGKPLVYGDQTLWTVFNSLDSTVTHAWWDESLDAFPVEFHQTVFARQGSGNDEQDIFANTVFIEWEIINKGNQQIDSTFFGFWTDIDFEPTFDNRPAIDIERHLGFCWPNNGLTYYDSIPPAVGYSLLYGPVVPSSGNTATFKGRQLANYENLSLSSFHGIVDDADPRPLYRPARSLKDAWNIARGFDSQGNIIIDPTTSSPTKFPLSGDPVTGSGWIYEFDTGGGAGFVFFSGPFTFAPNDTQWVMIAVVPGLGESNLNSITQMRRKAEILRSLPYDSLAFGTLSYPITDVEYEGTPIAINFKLEQNYPNPFNPTTKIKFTIPSVFASGAKQSQMVTLKIYDILGTEVATLVNEELSPGEYEVKFSSHSSEGQNLSSGIYFYQLRIIGPETSSGQGMIQTKKMILMK